MKVFTVEQLIDELKTVAAESPMGLKTQVGVDDFEGNIGAFGPVQGIEVVFDEDSSNVLLLCDPHEHLSNTSEHVA